MILTDKQKKLVFDLVKIKYSVYSIGISISDSIDLKMDTKIYQIFSATNDKLKILFVLFDGSDHSNKETQVKHLMKLKKYNIGHSVHYQFINDELYDIVLSDEIT